MTKEEVENIVRGITDKIEATTDIDDWAEFWGFTRDDYEEFLETAVKALQQEPCTDAISRQAAIDACLNGWNKDYKEIVEEIRALPPVKPNYTDAEIQKMQDLEFAEIQKAYELGKAEGVEVLEEIRAEIKQAADKQFQIAIGVADLNERYTHIQMENAYRHSLNIIDKYKASPTGEEVEE